MLTCYLAIRKVESTATRSDPREDILSITVWAVHSCDVQLVVSHFLSSFGWTDASSALLSKNRQCNLKLYAIATTVRTSNFALFIIILAKGFQEAFVAIVADELVMTHTAPPCGRPEPYYAASWRLSLLPMSYLRCDGVPDPWDVGGASIPFLSTREQALSMLS